MPDYEKICEDWVHHFEWHYVADNYAPCSILDYGCGYGYGDFYLAKAGFRVFGYDPDSERIRIANEIRSRRPFEIQERTEFSDRHRGFRSYDLVWTSHVLEHVPYNDWSWIFYRMIGTRALISVPLGYAYDMPEHIHHWEDGDAFREKLEEYSGFKWTTSVDEINRVIRAKLEVQ